MRKWRDHRPLTSHRNRLLPDLPRHRHQLLAQRTLFSLRNLVVAHMQLCIKPTERYKQKSYVFASYYQMSTNVYHVKLCHDSFFFDLILRVLKARWSWSINLQNRVQLLNQGQEMAYSYQCFCKIRIFGGH